MENLQNAIVETEMIEKEPIWKKKPCPIAPIYEGGCKANPNSKSYCPNLRAGKGKINNKQYKNKMYERITLTEYNELLDYKRKYFELTKE